VMVSTRAFMTKGEKDIGSSVQCFPKHALTSCGLHWAWVVRSWASVETRA
jgi:hypothetical protein